MLKALIWLALDYVFIKATIKLSVETGLWVEKTGEFNWYLVLSAAFVVWFTWELIRSIKEWLK